MKMEPTKFRIGQRVAYEGQCGFVRWIHTNNSQPVYGVEFQDDQTYPVAECYLVACIAVPASVPAASQPVEEGVSPVATLLKFGLFMAGLMFAGVGLAATGAFVSLVVGALDMATFTDAVSGAVDGASGIGGWASGVIGAMMFGRAAPIVLRGLRNWAFQAIGSIVQQHLGEQLGK